jgi:hypothetical protein
MARLLGFWRRYGVICGIEDDGKIKVLLSGGHIWLVLLVFQGIARKDRYRCDNLTETAAIEAHAR